MRALVTGGAGFIGSTLVDRLLAEGHSVDVVDDLSTGTLANLAEARSAGAMTFHQLDIRSPEMVELMASRRPDVVFHLAAQAGVRPSVEAPVHDAGVNVLGSLQVLEGARVCAASRVVYAASGGSLYGEPDPSDLPVRESHPHRPVSPYGISKGTVIEYLAAYRQMHGLHYSALALANVYGPRQDPHGEAGVVAIFAAHLSTGTEPVIFGDGTQTRDFVFVDDVVDAFVRASQRGEGMVINVGTGIETSVNDLYETMAKAAGVAMPARHGAPKKGDVQRSSLDPARAAVQLGWKAWTPLDRGASAVLEFARSRRARSGPGASGP